MNTNAKIRNAMRENERTLLAYLRRSEKEGRINTTSHLGTAWHNALERLLAAKKVRYVRSKWSGHYAAVKNARPVTRRAA